jgi:hypothetical protein
VSQPTAAAKARVLKLSKKKPRSSPNTFGVSSSTSGIVVGVMFMGVVFDENLK